MCCRLKHKQNNSEVSSMSIKNEKNIKIHKNLSDFQWKNDHKPFARFSVKNTLSIFLQLQNK